MSDDQFTKLTKTLGKRFDTVDQKLANHDQSFEKFFKYMEEMHSEMNMRFEKAAKDRADIRGAVAELSAQVKSYHEEMLFLTHKVDRMERWIHEIAKQTGVKLSEA